MNKVLECINVNKSFDNINILNNLNLSVTEGSSVAIVGSSGSGKTTLLQILAGLDSPDSGIINRSDLKNSNIGFIYQKHNLLPEFNALENVMLPLLIAKCGRRLAEKKALELLTQVGLQDRSNHSVLKLSGGECQRVAIARALVNSPKCIFADEPTGNLDENNTTDIFDLMKKVISEHNTTLVVVSHDLALANSMDRCLELRNGKLS